MKHKCHGWTNQAHPQRGDKYKKNMKHKCHGWTNQAHPQRGR
jgi:hypothetical protein